MDEVKATVILLISTFAFLAAMIITDELSKAYCVGHSDGSVAAIKECK